MCNGDRHAGMFFDLGTDPLSLACPGALPRHACVLSAHGALHETRPTGPCACLNLCVPCSVCAGGPLHVLPAELGTSDADELLSVSPPFKCYHRSPSFRRSTLITSHGAAPAPTAPPPRRLSPAGMGAFNKPNLNFQRQRKKNNRKIRKANKLQEVGRSVAAAAHGLRCGSGLGACALTRCPSALAVAAQKHKQQVKLVKSRTKKHAKKAEKKARAADDLQQRLAGSSEATMTDAQAPAKMTPLKGKAGKKPLKLSKRAKKKQGAAIGAGAAAISSDQDAMTE